MSVPFQPVEIIGEAALRCHLEEAAKAMGSLELEFVLSKMKQLRKDIEPFKVTMRGQKLAKDFDDCIEWVEGIDNYFGSMSEKYQEISKDDNPIYIGGIAGVSSREYPGDKDDLY